MNAAGRMDTAKAVIELFLTGDPARARELAQQLHEQNAERQQVEAEIRDTCERLAVDESAAALVYYAEDWHRGVLGIVASRGWWSACTGRCSCSAATPRTAWRRAPAAAFRRFTCWKPWKPCPTSSCASAATSTPPA